jgi:hypothetical protein
VDKLITADGTTVPKSGRISRNRRTVVINWARIFRVSLAHSANPTTEKYKNKKKMLYSTAIWFATHCNSKTSKCKTSNKPAETACPLFLLICWMTCSSTMTIEAICSFETLLPILSTLCYNREDHILHIHRHENMKCDILIVLMSFS